MNSSVNPPAASTVNPSSISSFTGNHNDDGTSLSSALAETVATLACFGSTRSKGANVSGQNNDNSSSGILTQLSSNAVNKGQSLVADNNGKNVHNSGVDNSNYSGDLSGMQEPCLQMGLSLPQSCEAIQQQRRTAEPSHVSNAIAEVVKETLALAQRGESSEPTPTKNNALPISSPCPLPTNPMLQQPMSEPTELHPTPAKPSSAKEMSSVIKRFNESHKTDQTIKTNAQQVSHDSLSSSIASLANLSNFATPNRKPPPGAHSSAPTASLRLPTRRRHSRSLSGPIISGTAFSAVLALQNRGNSIGGTKKSSPSNEKTTNERIIKTNESVIGSTSLSSPSTLTGGATESINNSNAALEQIALVSNSISKSATPSTNNAKESKKRPSPYTTQHSTKKSLTRSSDGAPIIAGTAAAAMAIATAARIATSNESETKTMHGFGMVHDSATLDRMVSLSTKAVLSMGVEDNNTEVMEKATATAHTPKLDRDNVTKVTPEESAVSSSSGSQTTSSMAHQPLHQNPSSVVRFSSQPTSFLSSSMFLSGNKNMGGMDILAEIISHVPPMAVPETSALSASRGIYSHNSYHHFPHHPPLHYDNTNAPAIPSYQEIYQEMGMAPRNAPSEYHYNKSSEALTDPFNGPMYPQYSYSRPNYSTETISNCEDFNAQSQQRPTTHYGHPIGGEIEEGKELYTRKDLMVMNGHMLEHKDVHGTIKEGADSVVLCNLEREIREGDGLCWFLYSCDRTNGGGALCSSYHNKRVIRVFRSSVLNGRFASPYLDEDEDDEIGYRYDGLYMVRAVWDIHGNETEEFPCAGEEGWQTYFFTRLPKKPLDGRTELGMQYNAMGLQELWGSIQKMKGVRKPKKFEIPQAPMKLGPMKRAVISGYYKDRKSSSYRPPVVQQLPPEKVSKKQTDSVFDLSTDEEPEKPLLPVKRLESGTSSRNERSPRMVPRPVPNKVVTPRPRMSSDAQELKKTISASTKQLASTETSDSSDNETETSGSLKKAKEDAPKLNSLSSGKRPNNLAQVISTLLPKRATAAKAEAANRDMLGKKTKRPYNRRSASIASPRKRSRRSKQDDESSASSIDGVDPNVLTVASRVLVFYKGSLFKATIRKRRENNGKHDFQIHYDGNKRSNVHWIPVDRIQKILSVAIDVAPVPAKTRNKKGKRGGWNKKEPESDVEDNNSGYSDDENVQDLEPDFTENDEASNGNMKDSEESIEAKTSNTSDEEEAVVTTDTNDNVARTSKNNSKKKRVTVFDNVEMVNTASSRGRPINRKKNLDHKSSSISSFDEADAGAEESSDNGNAIGDSTNQLKFPVGTHVYVEYRRIFYSSIILRTRQKRKLTEYLVHYEGFKKASDRWVKEINLHEVNIYTTRRFEEQRLTTSNMPFGPDLSGPAKSIISTRGKMNDDDEQSHQHFTRQKKPPGKAQSNTSDISQLGEIEAGVAFLPGSVVFAELSGALYLAKMVKKRFSGEKTEYLVSYDGYDSDYDAWKPLYTIYEVNPQTKRVFNKMNAEIKNGTKPKKPDPPKKGSERKKRDNSSTRSNSPAQFEVKTKKDGAELFSSPPLPRRRGKKKQDDDSLSAAEQASKQNSVAARAKASSIDMKGIPPGVEFLPGSTLFAEKKGSLCLAKMLKKRGKGDFMEYLVQFTDETDDDETMWISVSLLYEINPQTKRMFRQLSKG